MKPEGLPGGRVPTAARRWELPWNQLNTSHSVFHEASQACLVLSHNPLPSRIQTQILYICMLHVPPILYFFIWSLHKGLGHEGREYVGRHI